MTVFGFDDTVVLRDVFGHPATHSGITILPADLWTADRWEFPPSKCLLARHTESHLVIGEQDDGENLLRTSNALWVRARLPIVFGFAPPTCLRPLRRSLLNIGFLAITKLDIESVTVIPFVCVDIALQAELRFGRQTNRAEYEAVASAFWDLLANEPDALANFADALWVDDGHDPIACIVGYWGRQFQFWDWRVVTW